jgi:Na+-driven multidrug efflux pump
MMVGLFILGLSENLRKYMVAVGYPISALISSLFSLIIHPFWGYIFISVLELDLRGAALSSTLTFGFSFAIMIW